MTYNAADEFKPAIDGRRRHFHPNDRGLGYVCCYIAERGRGRPIVLVHDLRPTSSAFEMRPLFESLRWRRPTFALDLPGFGLSTRGEAPYSLDLFANVLGELVRKLRGTYASVDIVALGRGAEVAVRVASGDPSLVRSLAVIEPPGLVPARSGGSLVSLAARLALAVGQEAARGLFALMATRPMVRRAMRRRFRGTPDSALVDYACATARLPGAHLAPMALLAQGQPSSAEMARLYSELTVPSLVLHDARGAHAVALEAFLRGRANRFAIRVASTRGMPQFERRADTTAALERFWQSLSGAAWD
ncbi:MAG: alpha/beta fold hydrolase, partial [Polyangiaceae bacterium]